MIFLRYFYGRTHLGNRNYLIQRQVARKVAIWQTVWCTGSFSLRYGRQVAYRVLFARALLGPLQPESTALDLPNLNPKLVGTARQRDAIEGEIRGTAIGTTPHTAGTCHAARQRGPIYRLDRRCLVYNAVSCRGR